MALEAARANVMRNSLGGRIAIKRVWRADYSECERVSVNVCKPCSSRHATLILIHAQNHHTGGVSLTATSDDDGSAGPILSALKDFEAQAPDFVMCNPPFFASLEEVGGAHKHAGAGKEKGAAPPPQQQQQQQQQQQLLNACVDEMITPGGELAFVTAMIRDSLRLRGRVRWYTSMVGKKGTLRRVLGLLRAAGVENVRTTEFLQVRFY